MNLLKGMLKQDNKTLNTAEMLEIAEESVPDLW